MKILSIVVTGLVVASCALFSKQPVAIQCPKIQLPPAELMTPPKPISLPKLTPQ